MESDEIAFKSNNFVLKEIFYPSIIINCNFGSIYVCDENAYIKKHLKLISWFLIKQNKKKLNHTFINKSEMRFIANIL